MSEPNRPPSDDDTQPLQRLGRGGEERDTLEIPVVRDDRSGASAQTPAQARPEEAQPPPHAAPPPAASPPYGTPPPQATQPQQATPPPQATQPQQATPPPQATQPQQATPPQQAAQLPPAAQAQGGYAPAPHTSSGPPHAASPGAPPAAYPPQVGPPPQRSGAARWVALALAAVLLVGLGAAVGIVLSQRQPADEAADGGATGEVQALEPVSVTSVDPSGGSGLEPTQDGGWRTQTYNSAQFGNLKPGVGLLLDLGEPRDVASVTFEATTPGLTVELRAADEAAGPPDAYAVVDTVTGASGTVELDASEAGPRRYWLVWITTLGARDGGFGADISSPQVTGSTG